MTDGTPQDQERLARFASVGLCPRCRAALDDAAIGDAGLVCSGCGNTVRAVEGVVLAMPGEAASHAVAAATGESGAADEAATADGWAAGITADMDVKSQTYALKYDRRTRASNGFFIRREHALDMAGAEPGRVLEPGCGPGVVSPVLAERGVETHGADLSAGQLRTAARRDPRTLYVQGDLERLPYRDGVFDTVILIGVFEYVEQPGLVADELARVLGPGGRLVISVPNAHGLERQWTHYAYLPASRLAKRASGRRVAGYSRRLHTAKGLSALLKDAGLTPEETRFFDVVLAPPPFDRLFGDDAPRFAGALEKRASGMLRRVLAGQIITSAVKEGA